MVDKRSGEVLRMSEDKTLELISLYAKEECLWKTDSEFYTNKTARSIATQNIADALGLPEFEAKHVMIKMRNIRNSYCQELKKMAASLALGGEHRPRLFWFNLVDSFLRNYLKKPRFDDAIEQKMNEHLDKSVSNNNTYHQANNNVNLNLNNTVNNNVNNNVNNYVNSNLNSSVNNYVTDNVNTSVNDYVTNNVNTSLNDFVANNVNTGVNDYVANNVNTNVNNFINNNVNTSVNDYAVNNVNTSVNDYAVNNVTTSINNFVNNNVNDSLNSNASNIINNNIPMVVATNEELIMNVIHHHPSVFPVAFSEVNPMPVPEEEEWYVIGESDPLEELCSEEDLSAISTSDILEPFEHLNKRPREEDCIDPLPVNKDKDYFDDFGQYISSLLRALPQKKAMALQPQIIKMITTAAMEED